MFAVAGSLSLIVGFALFGAVTFLPLYFQTVDAASPTGSGLRLIPMMGGVLLTSIASGQIISRVGRYRAFPIAGTAIMALGLALLSRLDVGTGTLTGALFLLVLGLGLGMTMQVLVLAVQNAVDYSVLGSATSGVTMLRGIGGSLGTAVFGTIFSNRLAGAAGSGTRLTGDQVARLPPGARTGYEEAFVHALRPVFLVAAGVALVGWAISWLLEERPLRATAATSQGLEDALAAPKGADSLAEVERALARCTSREDRARFHARVAERAGTPLSPAATWALVRIEEHGPSGAREMAEAQDVGGERIAEVVTELRDAGLLEGEDGAATLTPAGRALADQLLAARRDLLSDTLADPAADRRPEVHVLLERLSRELVGERP